jgi:predicted amidohydrolase
MLIDAYGRKIAMCPEGEENVISGNVDMESLLEFRQKFPVLNDADNNLF